MTTVDRGPALLREAIAELENLEAEAFDSWKRYRQLVLAARARVAHLHVAELKMHAASAARLTPATTRA